MHRLVLTAIFSLVLLTVSLCRSSAVARSAPAIRIFTVTQMVRGLLDHTASWEGRTLLVRGRFVPYFHRECSRHCPFRGGLSDTGTFVNLLTLYTTVRTRALLVPGQPRIYHVRLHLGRYGTTLQPEGYLLG
jgi:hypothetical protein